MNADELAILCRLSGRYYLEPQQLHALPPAYAKLRDRVAVSMGLLALHTIREHGPMCDPTREELLCLLGSRDARVREIAAQLAVRACAS